MTGRKPLHVLPAKMLAQSDLEAIHQTSLGVLEKVGVEFQGEAALNAFRGTWGANVEGGRIFLSRQLVERAIDQSPGEFV